MDSDGVPLVRLPWLVDGAPIAWGRPAPRLGEHSLEILAELGYSDAQVAEFTRSGTIGRASNESARLAELASP